MERLARVLLLAGAAAYLRVAWLIWKRLGDGSICDYPSDCLDHWFPTTYGLLQPVWLLATSLVVLSTCLAWRACWSSRVVVALGAAGAMGFLSVAVTPVVWGSGPLGPGQRLDGHLWLRAGMEGYVAISGVFVATAVLLLWAAAHSLRAPRGDGQEDRLRALLWWPLGATPPLIVMTFGIAADAGRFVGLEDDTAGRLAVAPFLLLLCAQAIAARRESLRWATVASLLVVALEFSILLTQEIIWHRWTDDVEPGLVVRFGFVAAALLLPLALAWFGLNRAGRRTSPAPEQVST